MYGPYDRHRQVGRQTGLNADEYVGRYCLLKDNHNRHTDKSIFMLIQTVRKSKYCAYCMQRVSNMMYTI